MRINWFTTVEEAGTLQVSPEGGAGDVREITSTPVSLPEALYSDLEEKERPKFPDMFANANFKHSILLDGLQPGTKYTYTVRQGESTFNATFRTAPASDQAERLRIIAFADSETDPEGRVTFRSWEPAFQHPDGTGRPADVTKYLVTETEGFIENLKVIDSRQPDLVMLAGDIVQGGGYQRAWDEFFFHTAGKFGTLMTHTPLLLAAMAPRPLSVASGSNDRWADPASEFRACVLASPVFEFLGSPGLSVREMPEPGTTLHEGRIGYHLRPGGHGLLVYDWERHLAFAKRHWPESTR